MLRAVLAASEHEADQAKPGSDGQWAYVDWQRKTSNHRLCAAENRVPRHHLGLLLLWSSHAVRALRGKRWEAVQVVAAMFS